VAIRCRAGNGAEYLLTERVATGAQGWVYRVEGSQLLAKLLVAELDAAAARRRLGALVLDGRRPRAVGLAGTRPARTSWPLALIEAAGETPAEAMPGFLMEDLGPGRLTLETYLAPAGRAPVFPDTTWAQLLRAALDLAVLVRDVHAAEYVLGDLKPENLWVDAAGRVALCDVDSLQFSAEGEFFRCPAGSPGYTAPELIDTGTRLPSVHSDAFALAVLIYRLLLCGRHPFFGVPADGSGYLGLNDNIRSGRARLLGPGTVRVDPSAPDPRALPRTLRQLFRQCFDEHGRAHPDRRPTPAQWAEALADALQPSRLRRCPRVARHLHPAELPWCPWCNLAQRSGMEAFPG
jgi:DNA-binding helix-hairpin-helix protein with protein kinase domain